MNYIVKKGKVRYLIVLLILIPFKFYGQEEKVRIGIASFKTAGIDENYQEIFRNEFIGYLKSAGRYDIIDQGLVTFTKSDYRHETTGLQTNIEYAKANRLDIVLHGQIAKFGSTYNILIKGSYVYGISSEYLLFSQKASCDSFSMILEELKNFSNKPFNFGSVRIDFRNITGNSGRTTIMQDGTELYSVSAWQYCGYGNYGSSNLVLVPIGSTYIKVSAHKSLTTYYSMLREPEFFTPGSHKQFLLKPEIWKFWNN